MKRESSRLAASTVRFVMFAIRPSFAILASIGHHGSSPGHHRNPNARTRQTTSDDGTAWTLKPLANARIWRTTPDDNDNLTQNQVVETPCWFDPGQGHQPSGGSGRELCVQRYERVMKLERS